MESCLVITNEGAGTADQENLELALGVLEGRCEVEVVATSDPEELDEVLQRVGSRTIVVAGGDGSMHAVIAALHRRNDLAGSVVGLIPLGTGNDFARGLDIPLDPEEAARLLLDGEERPVDLLVDDLGEIVVNNVHVGASAQASRRGARWKKRLGSIGIGKVNLGKLGYPIGAFQSAFLPPRLRLRIEVDGEVVCDVTRPVLMAAVGNGASVGGGAHLTPEADPEDGKADVLVSRAITLPAKFAYGYQVLKRTHPERDDVLYLRGREVSVSGEEFYISADGEITGPVRRRAWRVMSAAYKMVLPRA